MLKYLRYALATVCFAASVGCLAVWGWTVSDESIQVTVKYFHKTNDADRTILLIANNMQGTAIVSKHEQSFVDQGWKAEVRKKSPEIIARNRSILDVNGWFFTRNEYVYFPLWSPALIFALAGVVALRLSGRFTIRSALIATTVMAVLLGIWVVGIPEGVDP